MYFLIHKTGEYNRIFVNTSKEQFDDSILGICRWELPAKDVKKLISKFTLLINKIDPQYEDDDGKTLEELPDDEIVAFNDPDSGIHLLAAMMEMGGTWHLDWLGDNEMWVFHDYQHALSVDVPSFNFDVDAPSEKDTLIAGAIMARDFGMSYNQIIPELCKAIKDYKERFDCEIGDIFEEIIVR
jgi:hypothetical protein